MSKLRFTKIEGWDWRGRTRSLPVDLYAYEIWLHVRSEGKLDFWKCVGFVVKCEGSGACWREQPLGGYSITGGNLPTFKTRQAAAEHAVTLYNFINVI